MNPARDQRGCSPPLETPFKCPPEAGLNDFSAAAIGLSIPQQLRLPTFRLQRRVGFAKTKEKSNNFSAGATSLRPAVNYVRRHFLLRVLRVASTVTVGLDAVVDFRATCSSILRLFVNTLIAPLRLSREAAKAHHRRACEALHQRGIGLERLISRYDSTAR